MKTLSRPRVLTHLLFVILLFVASAILLLFDVFSAHAQTAAPPIDPSGAITQPGQFLFAMTLDQGDYGIGIASATDFDATVVTSAQCGASKLAVNFGDLFKTGKDAFTYATVVQSPNGPCTVSFFGRDLKAPFLVTVRAAPDAPPGGASSKN